jgi:hypothetical protein
LTGKVENQPCQKSEDPEEGLMKAKKMNLIEACDKACGIVIQAHEMDRLYRKGIRNLGEGKLRNSVMNLAAEAIRDEKLREEVFVSDENVISFLCGVWIQFLLVEVAGLKKEKLQDLTRKAFGESMENKLLH